MLILWKPSRMQNCSQAMLLYQSDPVEHQTGRLASHSQPQDFARLAHLKLVSPHVPQPNGQPPRPPFSLPFPCSLARGVPLGDLPSPLPLGNPLSACFCHSCAAPLKNLLNTTSAPSAPILLRAGSGDPFLQVVWASLRKAANSR